MPHKTNAVRLLDRLGIQYELREYEVDPEDLAAETVAAKINLPTDQVFKTRVAHGDRHGICMAVIPGNTELDLKALAEASENWLYNQTVSRDARPSPTSSAASKTAV